MNQLDCIGVSNEGFEMKVVISGSRSVKSLNSEAIARIDTIINLGAEIVVGDCYGVDTLVQRYLASKNYTNVTVYHIGSKPRNNCGAFSTVRVESSRQVDKDKAMCAIADYGLAIWDGESRGTKANIDRVPTRVVRV